MLACVLLAGALVPAADLTSLKARVAPSVVHLEIQDSRGQPMGTGSGFAIRNGGWVATNHHVVENAGRVIAVLADGREVAAEGLLADDPDNDVAIIRLVASIPPLVLGSTAALKEGDAVAIIGSPRGYSGTLTEGIVSAFRREGLASKGIRDGLDDKADREVKEQRRSWQIQHTAPSSPGTSGSPLLDMDGNVVGMVVGGMTGSQGLNFAIPAEIITKVVDGVAADAAPKPFRPPPWRNLAISVVVFAGLALLAWAADRLVFRPRSRKPPTSA